MTRENAAGGPNNLFDGPLSAAFYDLFAAAMGSGPSSGNVQFYFDCVKSCRGPALKLGVGTGRVALQLTQKGFEVVVLEASRACVRANWECARLGE